MKTKIFLVFLTSILMPFALRAESFSPLSGNYTMLEFGAANAQTKAILKNDSFKLVDIFGDSDSKISVVWASNQWKFSKTFLTIKLKLVMKIGNRFAWTECSASTPIAWNKNKLTILESISEKTTSGFTSEYEPTSINCQINQEEKTFDVRWEKGNVVLRSANGSLLLDMVYRQGIENTDAQIIANDFQRKLKQ